MVMEVLGETINGTGGSQEIENLFPIQEPYSTGETGGQELVDAGKLHYYEWGEADTGYNHEIDTNRTHISCQQSDSHAGGKRLIVIKDLKNYTSIVVNCRIYVTANSGASNSGGSSVGYIQLYSEADNSPANSGSLGHSNASHDESNHDSASKSGYGFWVLEYDKSTEIVTCKFSGYDGEPASTGHLSISHTNDFTTNETIDVSGWEHVYIGVQVSNSRTTNYTPCDAYAYLQAGCFLSKNKKLGA